MVSAARGTHPPLWPVRTAAAAALVPDTLLDGTGRKAAVVAAMVPRDSRVRSTASHPRGIAARTGTARGTDCRPAAATPHLQEPGRSAGMGKGMGTGTDILVLLRYHLSVHSLARPSFPVYPYACPSSSLLYKVLKIIKNNII